MKLSSEENRALYHDRGTNSAGALTSNQAAVIWNPWAGISITAGSNGRVGNEIYPRGMAIRMYYNCAAARPSQFVRIIACILPQRVGSTILDGTNFDILDNTSSNDTVSGMVRAEGVKVLYDRMVTLQQHSGVNPTDVAKGGTRFYKKLWLKAKRGAKIVWQEDQATIVNKPFALFVIPYDDYTTLRTDNLGYLSWTYKMYFKDP